MNAFGLSCAHLRVATAISASCSCVVPYWCMWRMQPSSSTLGGPPTPNGISNCIAGAVGSAQRAGLAPREAMPRRAEYPISPCVISATEHRPASIAAAACSTWMTNDDPPTDVPSMNFGSMPRYSPSWRIEGPAVKIASTSDLSMPASASAFFAASAWSVSAVLPSQMPISSDSSTPTITALRCSVIEWPAETSED